jgi:hypothetical protein
MMYTVVATASSQYSFEKCLAANILHDISMMVQFFLSATPFFFFFLLIGSDLLGIRINLWLEKP